MTTFQHVADCARRYAQAQVAHDTRDIASVQAVLQARVDLATCLLAAGWTPPPELAAALEHDKAVLPLGTGSLERQLVLALEPTEVSPDRVIDLRADLPQQR